MLRPVLFFIFINDLPDNLNSKARIFADDCIVYREIKSSKDQLTLQEDLDTLAAWEQKRGMDFHPQKCNVLRVPLGKSPMTFSYRLKDTVLAEEATSKYLGMDLQNNLSWNQHVSRVTKRQTACSDYYAVICERPVKKPRPKLTCPWSDQTPTTAAPSGTLIKEIRNTKW